MSWRTSWRWVPGLNEFKRLKKQTFWVCNILQTTWQKSVFDEQRPSKTRTNSHNYLMRLIGKNNHTNLMLLTPLAIFGIKLPPRTLEGSPKKRIIKILRISNIKTSIQQWLLTPPSSSLRNYHCHCHHHHHQQHHQKNLQVQNWRGGLMMNNWHTAPIGVQYKIS